MKRFLLLLLALSLLASCGCASSLEPAAENTEEQADKEETEKEKPKKSSLLDVSEISPLLVNRKWDGKTLKVLSVGNSFARNATKVLYQIAKQEGVIAQLDTAIENAAADYQELTRLLGEKEEAELILMELMEQWDT